MNRSPVLGVYPDWPEMYRNARRPEGEEPIYGDLLFRASTESQMSLCPARTEVKTKASEKMFFGTLQHALIEGALKGYDLPSRDEVLAIGNHLLEREAYSDLDLETLLGHDLQRWLEEQRAMLVSWSIWYEAQRPLLEITEMEMSMIAPLFPIGHVEAAAPENRLWLGGTPDALAEHDLTVEVGLDWKTAGRMWQQGKADGSRQNDAYAWLHERIAGRFIEDWWYVIGDRGTGEWRPLTTKSTRRSADAAVHVIERQARYLLSGLPMIHSPHDGFGKRNWHCKPDFCENWNTCPGRYLGDEFDDLERTGSW